MGHQTSSPIFTRRAFIKTGASAAAVAGFAVSPQLRGHATYSPRVKALAYNAPAHSQSVVQRFGMNIQPTFANEYANFDAVAALLKRLGVRKVRAQVAANDPHHAMPYLQGLHSTLGITVHGTAGAFPLTDAERSAMPDVRRQLATVINQYGSLFNSLGGYNEPNGTRFGPRPSWWLDETLTHQQWLWNLVHGNGADSALRDVLVCGPSLQDSASTLQEDYQRCSVLKPYVERINMHVYPAGSVPSNLIDQRTQWARDGLGTIPVVVTETGYNNGLRSNAYAPVAPDVIGVYVDRLLMEHVIRGNDMYLFELLNNYPPSSTNSQNFYGLVSVPTPDPSSWQPMPAFRTMRRFLALMEDGDSPFTPQNLSLTLTGASDIKSYLVGKRDGSHLLILWRDVKLWDRNTRSTVKVSTATANLGFDSAKTVTTHVPSVRWAAFGTSRAAQHSIELAGNLVVAHIKS